MIGGNKFQVHELLRDRIITPRGYDGIEFNNYFSKVDWSRLPLSSGPVNKPRCVLATLTTNFHMTISTHLDRTRHNANANLGDNSAEEWAILLDISKLYNGIMYQKFLSPLTGERNDELELRFDEYKSRMYQLTTTDFIWMTPFENEDNVEARHPVNEAFLMTAQASGEILIWWIVVSPDSGQLSAEPVYTKTVVSNDIISAMKFHRVFANVGILAIGTNNGTVKVFRLEKLNIETDIEDEVISHKEPKFLMSEGFEIWGIDMMRIEFLESTKSSRDQNILKGPTVNLIIVKHPNYILSTLVTVSIDDIDFKPVEDLQSPDGPIVGISQYSDDKFMLSHEAGVLSLVNIRNGSIGYLDESVTPIHEENLSNRNETYLFNGLALSSNRVLACVGKNLSCTFDHLAVRDPGRMVFFSLLPEDNTFDFVKDLYFENRLSIPKISDVLIAFRYHIRLIEDMESLSVVNFPPGLVEKRLSEMTTEELRLYFWVIKAMVLPEGEEDKFSAADLDAFRANKAAILLRHLEIEDAIVRRHCTTLLKIVEENKDLPKYHLSGKNAESLRTFFKYLKSKPDRIPCKIQLQKDIKPSCPLCKSEVNFQETPVEQAVFPGLSWESQICAMKHRFPVCILSLLPCEFPYRICNSCHCTALIMPAFGQMPICPLCGELMLPIPVVGEDEEEFEVQDTEFVGPEDSNITSFGNRSKSRRDFSRKRKT